MPSKKTIFTITAVYISEDRNKRPDDHRAWTWASSLKAALAAVNRSPGWLMESGTYTHVVIEEYRELSIMESNAHWYRVPYDEQTHTYGTAKKVKNPRGGICSWGLG